MSFLAALPDDTIHGIARYLVHAADGSWRAARATCRALEAATRVPYVVTFHPDAPAEVVQRCLERGALRRARVVILARCAAVSDATVAAVAEHCPDLECLSLARCPGVTDASVALLLARRPALRLDLTGCWRCVFPGPALRACEAMELQLMALRTAMSELRSCSCRTDALGRHVLSPAAQESVARAHAFVAAAYQADSLQGAVEWVRRLAANLPGLFVTKADFDASQAFTNDPNMAVGVVTVRGPKGGGALGKYAWLMERDHGAAEWLVTAIFDHPGGGSGTST